MIEENIREEFRFIKIDETRNHFGEKIKQNYLVSKKHKKFCKVLIYIEHLLIFVSAINRCVSISAFASVIGIPIGIMSSVVGLKTCAWLQELKNISQ